MGGALSPLFVKVTFNDPIETGLGLVYSKFGNKVYEIDNNRFIQLDFLALQSRFVRISISSVQAGEGFYLYGSYTQGVLSQTPGNVPLYDGSSGYINDTPIPLYPYLSAYRYISVTASTGDVLVSGIEVDCSALSLSPSFQPI